MRTGRVCVLILCMAAIFLSGCKIKSSMALHPLPSMEQSAEEDDIAISKGIKGEPTDLEEPEDSEEIPEYQVRDVADLIYTEAEVDVSAEDGEKELPDEEAVFGDTVEYVESDREE